ncbi:MAG: hypothetical protein AB7T63_00415 [Planctomycetota bacterium]
MSRVRSIAARRVAILTLAEQDIERYLLGLMARVWRQGGIEVVVLSDLAEHRDADLAILHVDLTHPPATHLAWTRRFPRTINAGLAGIGKRSISSLRVQRGDGWGGPVIVKTDANYGGRPELELARERMRRAASGSWRGRLGLARRASRRLRPRLDPTAYPLHAHPDEVPAEVWEDPELIVERFVPERDAEDYVLRKGWYLGQRSIWWRAHASTPVIKASSIHRRVVIPPEEGIDAWRRQVGLEFGKVDVIRVDGRPVPLDVNPTPGCVGTGLLPGVPPLIEALAPGIHDLLG